MKRPIFIRALSKDERKTLEAGLRSTGAFVLRRCQILLASLRGVRAPQIAKNLGCGSQTARIDRINEVLSPLLNDQEQFLDPCPTPGEAFMQGHDAAARGGGLTPSDPGSGTPVQESVFSYCRPVGEFASLTGGTMPASRHRRFKSSVCSGSGFGAWPGAGPEDFVPKT